MKRVFHYTRGFYIPPILLARQIQVSLAGVGSSERPAAWFSVAPGWESSAANALPLRSVRWLGEQWRIEVQPEAAPLTWQDWLAQSGCTAQDSAAMCQGHRPQNW